MSAVLRVFRAPQIAAVAAAVASVALLSGCSGSSGGPAAAAAAQAATTPVASVPVTTSSAPATSSSAPAASGGGGGGAKCTDLTNTAASAAVGKPATVKLSSATDLPGLSICAITVANEIYPIQLAVDTNSASAAYTIDQQALAGVDLSGLGDKAFSSAIGVETISGNVDIKVTGPAGPVLSKDYTIPTAIAKAMISALS